MDNPHFQHTRVEDDGRTIHLPLAMKARQYVFVMTLDELEEFVNDDLVVCEFCEMPIRYAEAQAIGSEDDFDGYICKWCVDDNKPKVYETEM